MPQTSFKPSFIVSKGERQGENGIYHDELDKYREIAKGIYLWGGLPKDIPNDYIEQALFDFGSVSAKNVPGLGVIVCPASPTLYNLYGEPSKWTPTGQTYPAGNSTDLLKVSENPVLFLGKSMASRIELDSKILLHAKISLLQNVWGMRQPIALESNPGNNQDAIVFQNQLYNGQPCIPLIDTTKVKAEVIELGIKDFTQPLINVEQDQDAKILTLLGIDNRGVEKASGINVEESTAQNQQLSIILTKGLLKRQLWCEKINPLLVDDAGNKYTLSVRINPAYDQTIDSPEDEVQNDKDGEVDGEQ